MSEFFSDVLSSLSSLPSGSTENQSSLTTPEHSLQSTTIASQSTVSKLVFYVLDDVSEYDDIDLMFVPGKNKPT